MSQWTFVSTPQISSKTSFCFEIIITDLELESDIIKIFNFMYKKFHSHYVPEFITELYCPLKRVLESCNLKLWETSYTL